MSSAYAVAGAASDAMNSEEAEAIAEAARSAGSAAWTAAEGIKVPEVNFDVNDAQEGLDRCYGELQPSK